MTKELNLFTSETNETNISKTTSVDGNKPKDGSSLFDSLLSKVKPESSDSTEIKPQVQNNTNKQSAPIEEQTIKIEAPTKNISKVNVDNQNEKSSNTDKTIKTDTLKEISVEKDSAKNLSFLDRMLIESKNSITNTKESANPNNKVSLDTEDNVIQTEKQTDKTVLKILNTNPSEDKDTTSTENLSKEKTSEVKVKVLDESIEKKSLFDTLLKETLPPKDESLEVTKKVSEDSNASLSKLNETTKVDTTTPPVQTQLRDTKSAIIKESNEKVNTNKEKIVSTENIKINRQTHKIDETFNKDNIRDTSIVPQSKNLRSENENLITKNEEIKVEKIDGQSVKKDLNTKSDITQNITTPKDQFVNNELQTPKKVEVDKSVIKQEIVKNSDTVTNVKEIEVKKVVNNEVQTTKVVENVTVKNETVAKELAKISNTVTDEKVNISKNEINKTEVNVKTNKSEPIQTQKSEKSLLDKLLDQSKNFINNSKETFDKEEVKTNINLKQNIEKSINPLVANMYLSSQKSNIKEAALVKVSTGKNIANNATNVKDVEKSAQFLGLGLEDTEVTVKMQDVEKSAKLNVLDKLAFSKVLLKDELTKSSNEIISKQINTASISTAASNEKEVQINVSAQANASIESRIIGARQNLGTMMSDVARNMYLNYKPPVTAFKINLMPTNLGSIAIVMKSDKDSGLSISLNMTNSATLDSFVDNQSALRASLAKNFSSETNFNLDFNMQNQSNNSNDSSNNSKNSQSDTESNSEITNNETEIIQETTNNSYM